MDWLITIIGSPPVGYEVLEYIFRAFILLFCLNATYDVINNFIREWKGL